MDDKHGGQPPERQSKLNRRAEARTMPAGDMPLATTSRLAGRPERGRRGHPGLFVSRQRQPMKGPGRRRASGHCIHHNCQRHSSPGLDQLGRLSVAEHCPGTRRHPWFKPMHNLEAHAIITAKLVSDAYDDRSAAHHRRSR
jgi:hypothetical protein